MELPDGVYHVMNRGVLKSDIVVDDQDRGEWFRLFHRVAVRCGWRVFAHVLMTNHYHVFLRLTSANLSVGMHDLQSGYATLFNKRHQRDGVLFRGRFKSLLVESEGHAWSLSRYLHLNPCRAGLVPQPEGHWWSTYRHFLDPSDAPPWLDWRTVLSEFSGTEAAARVAYRRYVLQGLEHPIENPFEQAYEGVLLGSPQFIEAHRHLIENANFDAARFRRSATWEDVLAIVVEDFQTTRDEITRRGRHGNVAREVALWLARETMRVPLTELAKVFGISKGTASSTISQCENRQSKSADLRGRCETLRGRVFGFSELAGSDLDD
jgi:REP element-mobilizing transposase RayT